MSEPAIDSALEAKLDAICELAEYFPITVFGEIIKGQAKKPFPGIKSWQAVQTQDKDKLRRFFSKKKNQKASVAIAIPHEKYFCLDVDMKEGKDGFASLEEESGLNMREYMDTYRVATISGGSHFHFNTPGEEYTFHLSGGKVNAAGMEGIDTRCKGNLAICPPTPGYTSKTDVSTIGDCPKAILDVLEREFKEKAEAKLSKADKPSKKHKSVSIKEMKGMLDSIDPKNYESRELWLKIMMSCHHGSDGEEWGKKLFVEWSLRLKQDWKEDPVEYVDRTWDRLKLGDEHRVTIGSLIHEVVSVNNTKSEGFTAIEDITTWDIKSNGALCSTETNIINLLTKETFPNSLAYNAGEPNGMCGLLRYNEMKEAIVFTTKPPWGHADMDEKAYKNYRIKDVDYGELNLHLLRSFKMNITTERALDRAVLVAATRLKFNPVKDELNSYVWDGVERTATMLIDHCGSRDKSYTRSISKRFMISAVARAFMPGCKADVALVLEGPQGIMKSTLVEVLGGEFYGNPEIPLGDKDSEQNLAGAWIVEWAEFVRKGAKDMDTLKGFLSKRVNLFRASYGKTSQEWPRRCVFIITTNEESGYLDDATGNRRFWPQKIQFVDIKWFIKYRDQLWAEAVHYFKAGEQWHLTKEEEGLAKVEQLKRNAVDPWKEIISDFIFKGAAKHRTNYRANEIAIEALEMTIKDLKDRSISARVGKCLKELGLVLKSVRRDGYVISAFCKPAKEILKLQKLNSKPNSKAMDELKDL